MLVSQTFPGDGRSITADITMRKSSGGDDKGRVKTICADEVYRKVSRLLAFKNAIDKNAIDVTGHTPNNAVIRKHASELATLASDVILANSTAAVAALPLRSTQHSHTTIHLSIFWIT